MTHDGHCARFQAWGNGGGGLPKHIGRLSSRLGHEEGDDGEVRIICAGRTIPDARHGPDSFDHAEDHAACTVGVRKVGNKNLWGMIEDKGERTKEVRKGG